MQPPVFVSAQQTPRFDHETHKTHEKKREDVDFVPKNLPVFLILFGIFVWFVYFVVKNFMAE